MPPTGKLTAPNREAMPVAREPYKGREFSASGKIGSGKRRRRRNKYRD
jgi:hypothetical protein